MTNREFFNAILSADVADELRDYATAEIEKLDARNAQRKAKPSKTAIENEPIKVQIVEYLAGTDAHLVASDIAENLEISSAKASALCRQLVTDEKIGVEQVKIKGRKLNAYYHL